MIFNAYVQKIQRLPTFHSFLLGLLCTILVFIQILNSMDDQLDTFCGANSWPWPTSFMPFRDGLTRCQPSLARRISFMDSWLHHAASMIDLRLVPYFQIEIFDDFYGSPRLLSDSFSYPLVSPNMAGKSPITGYGGF